MSAVDIVIVGGGPAGAATACWLAAAGREVMLLERSAGPHHKVCGEFLGADTVAQLGRLQIDPSRLGAVGIGRMTVTTGSRSSTVRLPFRAFSLSRYRLDQAIVEQAVRAGAELRRGVAVQVAEPAAKGWRLRCNEGTEISCRSIVVASGKWPLRGVADRRDRSMVGLKMHLRLPDASTRALAGRVELFLFGQGYAGLEQVEDGVTNLCVILPGPVVARIRRGWPALRDYLVQANACLAAPLAGSLPVWESPLAVVCSAGGYLHGELAQNGIYPVGDRLAHIPPLAGDGLAIALTSAEIAAEHIRRDSPPKAYLADARRRVAPAIRLADAVSRLTGCPFGRALMMAAAAHAPKLLQAIAQRTRLARLAFADIGVAA